MNYDASAVAERIWPVEALHQLRSLIGDFVVVGALARDFVVHGLAGLPRGRDTRDLDVAVAVPGRDAYAAALDSIGPPGGLILRREIAGVDVDLIPFGELEQEGVVEIQDGVVLDVTGMREAFETAISVTLKSGSSVKTANLTGMILLKLVAWDMRGRTDNRDATDLGALLDASYSGVFWDRCWEPGSATERWDWDERMVGPHLEGQGVGRMATPRTAERLRGILSRDAVDRLVLKIPGHERRQQLAAFREGLDSELGGRG